MMIQLLSTITVAFERSGRYVTTNWSIVLTSVDLSLYGSKASLLCCLALSVAEAMSCFRTNPFEAQYKTELNILAIVLWVAYGE